MAAGEAVQKYDSHLNLDEWTVNIAMFTVSWLWMLNK